MRLTIYSRMTKNFRRLVSKTISRFHASCVLRPFWRLEKQCKIHHSKPHTFNTLVAITGIQPWVDYCRTSLWDCVSQFQHMLLQHPSGPWRLAALAHDNTNSFAKTVRNRKFSMYFVRSIINLVKTPLPLKKQKRQ